MDTELPDVLNQLVGSYEQFIKTQKEKSDLISKFSDSGLKKVKQDTTLQEQVCSKRNYLSLAISSAPPPPPKKQNTQITPLVSFAKLVRVNVKCMYCYPNSYTGPCNCVFSHYEGFSSRRLSQKRNI